MYNVIFNDIVGKNTTSKYQCTTESMRNVNTLLDYVNSNRHNWINWKSPRVTTIKPFSTNLYDSTYESVFVARQSVRVSKLVHPLKCTRKYCNNKTFHKLHHCIPAQSTLHYKILHTSMIIHTKTLLTPQFYLLNKM